MKFTIVYLEEKMTFTTIYYGCTH